MDTATLRNITDYRYDEADETRGNGIWCLKVNYSPFYGGAYIDHTGSSLSMFIRGILPDLDGDINTNCGTEWNAAIYLTNSDPELPVTAWLSN